MVLRIMRGESLLAQVEQIQEARDRLGEQHQSRAVVERIAHLDRQLTRYAPVVAVEGEPGFAEVEAEAVEAVEVHQSGTASEAARSSLAALAAQYSDGEDDM